MAAWNWKLKNIADCQGGYFTSAQAIQAGYLPQQQRYHTLSGNWEKAGRAIYRLHGYTDSEESEFIRWTFWTVGRNPSRSAVISHQSALHYYGFSDALPAQVHLSVPVSQRNYKDEQSGCVFHRQDLSDKDCIKEMAFTITTPLRTLLDMKPDLILNCRWSETVKRAWNKKLIDDECMNRLLAGTQEAILPATVPEAERGIYMARQRIPAMQQVREYPPTEHPRHRRNLKANRIFRSNSAFTLVELLVVIAIISILASMMMPALVKARESATSLKCANNLRNIGEISSLYANDYHGKIPAPVPKSNWYWMMTLQAYQNNGLAFKQMNPAAVAFDRQFSSVFVCSKYGIEKRYISGWTWQCTGYGMNTALPPCNSSNTWAERIATYPQLERVKRPSQTIVYGDSVGTYKPDIGEWHLGAAASSFEVSSIFGYVHQGSAMMAYSDHHVKAGSLPYFSDVRTQFLYNTSGSY